MYIGIVLLLFGVLAAFILLRAMLLPIIRSLDLSQYFFQKKLKLAENAFQDGCKAFSAGEIQEGFNYVEQSFYFGCSKNDLKFLDKIARYNFSVIDRLSDIISDETSTNESLALLEGLFQSRTEILKALTEEQDDTGDHLYKELLDRCKTNEKTIRAHLKTIALSLTRKPSPHVSYH